MQTLIAPSQRKGWQDVPVDILVLLFVRLSAEMRPIATLVCRYWHALLGRQRASLRWYFGSITQLRWALESGYPREQACCYIASRDGDRELRLARALGCAWDASRAYACAPRHGSTRLYIAYEMQIQPYELDVKDLYALRYIGAQRNAQAQKKAYHILLKKRRNACCPTL
jgi:hypothetical protein